VWLVCDEAPQVGRSSASAEQGCGAGIQISGSSFTIWSLLVPAPVIQNRSGSTAVVWGEGIQSQFAMRRWQGLWRVWTLRYQARAQYSAIEWTRAKVAVRKLFPEPASDVWYQLFAKWPCYPHKKFLISRQFEPARIALWVSAPALVLCLTCRPTKVQVFKSKLLLFRQIPNKSFAHLPHLCHTEGRHPKREALQHVTGWPHKEITRFSNFESKFSCRHFSWWPVPCHQTNSSSCNWKWSIFSLTLLEWRSSLLFELIHFLCVTTKLHFKNLRKVSLKILALFSSGVPKLCPCTPPAFR